MSAQKTQPTKVIKANNKMVNFTFYNFSLDNVPFYHKTLSLKMHYRLTTFQTDPTRVENFVVKWTKVIQFSRQINRDALKKPVPSLVDITIYTHSGNKGGGKDEIASGKLDLAQLVRTGKKVMSIPLQSNILESNLSFEIQTSGDDSFFEANTDAKPQETIQLPVIQPIIKNSWFNFKHNPDLIEEDANHLVEAALRPLQVKKSN